MNTLKSRRGGAILLQALIMAAMLSYLSVSIMRWVLQRHMGATRACRGGAARARTGGYVMKLVSNPNTQQGNCGESVGGTELECDNSGGVITIDYDEEQEEL